MRKSKIKIWELSLLLALCISLCQASVEAGRQSALSEKLIRLHVIAASDSEEAQALKLKVRDAVTGELAALLAQADSGAEAEALIDRSSPKLLSAARKAAGGESVELVFGRESYPFRRAEGYSLPAGEYSSLRIIIGEGAGHNWWGVIFPQLDAAGGYAEAAKLLSEEELSIIYESDSYELRFRFLELLQQLRAWLR